MESTLSKMAWLLLLGCSPAGGGAPFLGGGAGGSAGLFDGGAVGGTGGLGLDGNVGEPCTASDPAADVDGDGVTLGGGDCDDCNALVNPGAFDYAGDGIDQDCSGQPDDEPAGCDAGLAVEADDPVDAARAIGLCRMQGGASWGLVSARWAFPDGSTGSIAGSVAKNDGGDCYKLNEPPAAMSRGVLPKFGAVTAPREGASMLALSSGVAREGRNGGSPWRAFMCRGSATPPGFPKDSPACSPVVTASEPIANDGIALEVVVKVPTNAHALHYDFDFFTYEWPGYVCDVYNDFFVALLTSQAPTTPADHDISFDSDGNPVSVNNALLQACAGPVTVGNKAQKSFQCPLGTGELLGTGFDPDFVVDLDFHAATSWLVTQAEVVPGETITLRFAIWDQHDMQLDSTVLIDHFGWEVEGAGPPQTQPIPR